jgi:hypothetical protein
LCVSYFTIIIEQKIAHTENWVAAFFSIIKQISLAHHYEPYYTCVILITKISSSGSLSKWYLILLNFVSAYSFFVAVCELKWQWQRGLLANQLIMCLSLSRSIFFCFCFQIEISWNMRSRFNDDDLYNYYLFLLQIDPWDNELLTILSAANWCWIYSFFAHFLKLLHAIGIFSHFVWLFFQLFKNKILRLKPTS